MGAEIFGAELYSDPKNSHSAPDNFNGETLINKPNGTGIGRILKATDCSRKGFVAAWRFEAAFRQEAGLAILMFPLSFWLAQSAQHWALLVSVLLLVLIVELLNSAIETLTDRVSLERHELSGRAKDLGSAAVTLSLTIVAVVWGVAIYQKFAG